jgi:hypothetical protein
MMAAQFHQDGKKKMKLASHTLAAALAFLAALPTPAAAQSVPMEDTPHPGQRRPQDQQQPAAAVRITLSRAVACQVGRDAAALEPLLAAAPYSAEEAAAAARILTLLQQCLDARNAITVTPVVLRGAVAEALYESRFATAQAARGPALGVAPLLRAEAATANAEAAALVPMYTMAQCTAARHGEPVRALLATDPGTPAVQAAVQALNPAFVDCARGIGNLTVDGRILRGVLAESLYRWSVVQRDGPASPWAAPAAPAAR